MSKTLAATVALIAIGLALCIAAAASTSPYVVGLRVGCVWGNGKPVLQITRRPWQVFNIENRGSTPVQFSSLPGFTIEPGDVLADAYPSGVYRITTCGGRTKLIVSVHPLLR